MFFQERIKSISLNDKVLEVGPGASPYFRSDVLLEKKFDDSMEYERQFGTNEKLITDKEIIFYEGDIFPFKDKEFDYVICSHVLEHVDNLQLFLSEVFRVAKSGYFEYPLIYYDFLYNIDAHVNFLKYNNGTLNFCKKNKTSIYSFSEVQKFFFESLNKGYTNSLNDLLPYFMEGFEWKERFSIVEVDSIQELCHKEINLSIRKPVEISYTSWQLFKKLIKSFIGS